MCFKTYFPYLLILLKSMSISRSSKDCVFYTIIGTSSLVDRREERRKSKVDALKLSLFHNFVVLILWADRINFL